MEAKKLTERFALKRDLLDVKFDLHPVAGATVEQVCAEVNALYDAVDAGASSDLDFQDSQQ